MNLNAIESAGYQVLFGNAGELLIDFLSKKNYSKILFLVDMNTSEHCYPGVAMHIAGDVAYDIIEIDPGEESKNIDICIGIWKLLLEYGADRNSLLINLGGGVVTDMGSFAAATYKRGIDFLQIPTTLLAQVDASVGGKTGIDVDAVKNMIGTFSNPQTVLIDTSFLETLPQRELVSGFAEMIKHGLIMDKSYFEAIRTMDINKPAEHLIYESVMIKNQVVLNDPKEKGERKKLNFGHTIGHGVETYSLQHDKPRLLHGEAIAVGMIAEAWLSVKHAGLPESDLKTITDLILNTFPRYIIKAETMDDCIAYMKHDKKNEGDQINFTLLNNIGESTINYYCSEEAIRDAMRYYNSLAIGK